MKERTQYYEDVRSPQTDLKIQRNQSQISEGCFLGRNWQTGFKCYKEMQRDTNSQVNIEERRLEDSEAHYTITLINISLGK